VTANGMYVMDANSRHSTKVFSRDETQGHGAIGDGLTIVVLRYL